MICIISERHYQMNRRVIIIVLAFFAVSALAHAATCKPDKSSCPSTPKKIAKTCPQDANDTQQSIPTDEIDNILLRLRGQTGQLKTYQAEIHYLFIQDPEYLDSQTLRKGQLYYKLDKSGSRLRVRFETLKQDDGQDEKYVEDFIFDGVWLTRIDYQLEKVDFYQQAPEGKPIDVFEFISHRFPLIGFTKTEHLRRQFHITLVPQKEPKSNAPIGLRLIPKKDSAYKDDYKSINFWIDKKTFLPAKLGATSTEGDIFDIELLDIKVNKKIKNAVFKLETPKHFSQNRAPLKKN